MSLTDAEVAKLAADLYQARQARIAIPPLTAQYPGLTMTDGYRVQQELVATLTAEISGDTVTLGYVWVGEPDAGRSLLPALRSIGEPDAEAVGELSYLALQTRDDNTEGHSYRRYWKGHYLPELTDSAIGALLDRDPTDPTVPAASLQAYGGAIADVDEGATAFSHRRTRFEYVAAARWTDPDEDDPRMTAARATAAKLDRFAAGAYVNALGDEGAAGVLLLPADGKFLLIDAAAPVLGAGGELVAAVSVVVHAEDAHPQQLGPAVRVAARGISRALGWQPR